MIGKKINQLATELAPVSTDLTIIGDPTTGVSKKITLAQLGAIFSGAVSFYTNLAGFPALGDINVIYCAKDTQKLYLWNGSAYTEVFPAQALLDTYQLRSEKGVSNGYASLDSGGKVPVSQLPSSIMEYKGMWNAATNTPTLANGTGDTGDVYICNVAGTVNFGAGPITFAVGDYVIYSGSIWQRSSGAVGTVTSVAASITGNAIGITGSPVTTSGTLAFAFAGTGAQYIKGDGTLATFPSTIAQAERLITEVYNSTGATLTKGTIVYINGGQGNLPTVTKALATGDSTSAQTFGVVQADITNNNNGYVVVAGNLSDLDTQAYTEGTQLYLSATTAGTWTSTKQYAPNHLVYVGIVVRAHPTQGIVEIKIQNGYELDELHDVAAQNPDNNDILQYKTSTSLWTKVAGTTSNIAEGSNLYYTDARSRAALSFTAGSGAYNSTTGVITIPTNTNQLTNGAAYITLASLSAGAGISYNNTTGVIASTITQYTDAMARASISLTTTGTSGAATYNSTTGVLNVPQYAPDLSGYVPTSRTLTINGTAYDLSTNRSWSVGTVTSVGLSSATSGVSIGSTPVTTSGTITLAIATASGSQQGLLSSTDWTTFNNKQNALTNPVTGTGTTNYLPKFTGTSTIGDSQIFDNGTNVGIGTASPTTKLSVYAATGGSSTGITVNGSNNMLNLFGSSSSGAGVIFDATDGTVGSATGVPIIYRLGGTERMRLDASGNLGLGVTPSNAYADSRTFEIGANGILWSEASSSIYNSLIIGLNFYYNAGGTAVYKNSSIPSSRYIQYQGSHQWYNSPSGTAGNAISFTQAMTLDANGRLGIGATSMTYALQVNDVAGGNMFRFASGSTVLDYYVSGGNPSFGTASNNDLRFRTNDTTRLTIASTGAATFSSSVTATQFIVGSATTSSDVSVRYKTDTGDFSTINDRGSHAFGIYDHQVSSYRMYINTSGNVGIGTTSPTSKLTVYEGDLRLYKNHIETNSATWKQNILFTDEVDRIGARIVGFREQWSGAPMGISFETGGVGTTTERMRITSGGLVGIGTSSPAERLTVAGNFRVNGANANSKLIIYDNYSNSAVGVSLFNNSGTEVISLNGNAGNINCSNNITTGAPSVGSAHSWKLGSYSAGGTGTATGVIYIEVNGQVYSIPALLGTP